MYVTCIPVVCVLKSAVVFLAAGNNQNELRTAEGLVQNESKEILELLVDGRTICDVHKKLPDNDNMYPVVTAGSTASPEYSAMFEEVIAYGIIKGTFKIEKKGVEVKAGSVRNNHGWYAVVVTLEDDAHLALVDLAEQQCAL